MCGRFTIISEKEVLEKRFHARFAVDYKHRYNAAPSQRLPVILNSAPREIRFLKWGLNPPWLQKIAKEVTLLSGEKVQIPKCNLIFKEWNGEPIQDTYNHKAVIDFEGDPLFAELAILRMLEKAGWNGVWADSYRNKFRTALPEKSEPVSLPLAQAKFINSIKQKTGKRGGCWDVFAWKGGDIKFVESKRSMKDALRENQILWLETCLEMGIAPDSFLLVEWGI
jgi:hypothetical protein